MSLLGHEDLENVMGSSTPLSDRLVITPLLDAKQIGAASVDLRLGTDFLTLRRTGQGAVDTQSPHVGVGLRGLHERVVVPFGQRLWLHPGQFLLGSTLEFVRMPTSMSGLLIGRSSWARVGLLVEIAGLVQPGYAGSLTYELGNVGDSPVAIYPGQRVAQLAIYRLSAPTRHAELSTRKKYPATYLAPVGPVAPRNLYEAREMAKIRKLGTKLEGPAARRA